MNLKRSFHFRINFLTLNIFRYFIMQKRTSKCPLLFSNVYYFISVLYIKGPHQSIVSTVKLDYSI
jgi:hypothetical protein